MIGIVVLGTVLMDSGILLLLLERWKVARRPAWSQVSAASTGHIGPMLQHIAQVENEMAGLDAAIDALLPEPRRIGHEHAAPAPAEVAGAYRSAHAQLVALSSTHLRRPPSPAMNRFGTLCRRIGHDLDDHWDPHADELAALDIALRDLHLRRSDVEPLGVTPWENAAERYVAERRRRASAARVALVGHLDAVGDAIRSDRRRLRPTSGRVADLGEVNRELRRAVGARLDGVRPLLVAARRGRGAPALRRRDRAMLAEHLASVTKQVAAADVLAGNAPLASLGTLAALQLPSVVGLPPDTAFGTGCRAVEAGLRVCTAQGDAELNGQIAQYAAIIDEHLDRLHTTVTAEAQERRGLHHMAFRSVLVAADRVTLAVARALLDSHSPTPFAATLDDRT